MNLSTPAALAFKRFIPGGNVLVCLMNNSGAPFKPGGKDFAAELAPGAYVVLDGRS